MKKTLIALLSMVATTIVFAGAVIDNNAGTWVDSYQDTCYRPN